MKKLFTFLMVASLAFTIQAQDVTTQLGSGGKFFIKDNSGVTNFEFTHDIVAYPEFKIGKNFSSVGADAYMFRVQNTGIGPAVSIENVGTGTPALYFHKSQSGAIPTSQTIGEISFTGYSGSQWYEYAGINGSLNATNGGTLSFLTGTGGGVGTRMTIESDGKVGIGETIPTSTLDVDGTLSLPIVATIASTYIMGDSDYTLVGTSGTLTVTLPEVTDAINGRVYIIKRRADAVTINPSASQAIDGLTTFTLDNVNEFVVIQAIYQAASPTTATWVAIGGKY